MCLVLPTVFYTFYDMLSTSHSLKKKKQFADSANFDGNKEQ